MTTKAFEKHLKTANDLQTTYAEYRAGFIAFALEKNKRSTPYIERARALKSAASSAETPEELLEIHDIQDALLYASGISDKAKKFLTDVNKKESIENLIENFLKPAGDEFIDELVFRYLLFQGDSLGGSMRNIAGALAQQKLTRSIIAALDIANIPYKWLDSRNKKYNWLDKPEDDYDIEIFAKGISWNHNGTPRTLVYNINVPLVRKNVDICLFDCEPDIYVSQKINKQPKRYLLLGELKGGIDPAGADEHWKTANTALSRIRDKFQEKGLRPKTIFIGAAIEKSMAIEIWNQLQSDLLTNSANLTKAEQVSSLCRWLIHL
ncbi:AvaI/BsoBI family type II restriction endonuclease [Melghirimyces algeriensis]|uniref:Type II restriction enzyme n=1 Tax=Melghirimyces algeriensis TaxID=910412 RepID=A0A521FDH6_9BACL|nr:AvaI/BsoBI family type II restriction endonuclease [Melghirimyces algeriensis]SMO93580.1 type II restriction enzyme [Melghirimyces algeriensis]